ncbi:MAG: FecCD family ABC transporter permease [Bacillota bacterium]
MISLRRINPKVPAILMGLALATAAVITLNMMMGEYPIPPLDVWKTVFGVGSGEYDFVVKTLRLPRNLVAVLVGAALGVSGAILQGMARNPLASPDVIGITGGANLAAVAVIALYPKSPLWALPVSAFAGAALAAALTYLLAWKGGSSPIRMVLVGIGIASVAAALTTVILTHARVLVVSQAMVWMTGSVYARSWEHLRPLLPWLLLFLPLAFAMARHLDALQLGDEVARGLGSRVEANRGVLLLTSVALAGAAVATAGAIGFVGLMAPHISRRLVGPTAAGLLPTAALVGGLLVVFADMLGRVVFAPIEIPAGVITALVGAPYFIYLLYQTRNA